jgi:signal recognition particle GTPase
MVLAELGQRISKALASMSAASVIDEAVLDACLKEIATALLQADVNVRLVAGMRSNVKKRVNVDHMASGLNKQRVIEKVSSSARAPPSPALAAAGLLSPFSVASNLALYLLTPSTIHPMIPGGV